MKKLKRSVSLYQKGPNDTKTPVTAYYEQNGETYIDKEGNQRSGYDLVLADKDTEIYYREIIVDGQSTEVAYVAVED